MLFEIAKHFGFIQSLVVNLQTSLHPSIMHNLGKIEMIKRALWNCELEEVPGDYFEFGIYEGTALYAAVKAHKKNKSKLPRRFFGFDSFDEGFKYFDDRDKHPFFKEGDFVSSYEKTKNRFKKFPEVTLVKGYFEDTVTGGKGTELYGDRKCAVIFIDCDLMHPALVSLNYVQPILQAGSIIILDDYFAYKGNSDMGTAGALKQFLTSNPAITVREFGDYGYGGKAFIVTSIE